LADAPEDTVRRYVEAFNAGDMEGMARCFDATATILDGMAPHVWRGPAAAREWYRDVLAEGEHAGAANYVVTLGAPMHADVTGEAAYVVMPASMRFDVHGQPVTQTDAIFVVALRRVGEEWRIASWAWAKGRRAT
jgi:ketosteroid isomerase-like protein